MEKERYNHLNKYLKEKFGERTLKVCIDAGFTCPNRDGKVGTGGCIFCSEKGSGEHLKPLQSSNDSISNDNSNNLNSTQCTRKHKIYYIKYSNSDKKSFKQLSRRTCK